MTASVVSVAARPEYGFSKTPREEITLLQGLGVEGDVHRGETVKHRSRIARDPTQPNLRQVHLIHQELLDELYAKGFEIPPAALGENILTRGVDLLDLPQGAALSIGESAVLRVTGLRNPCAQIEAYQTGLLKQMLGRDEHGGIIRKTGVMAVVLQGGPVRVGDQITAQAPEGERLPLVPV